MTNIAIHLRSMQFFAHRAHNNVAGPTFFQDHEFLGDLYPAYEAAYDKVVEREKGLGEKPDLASITVDAARMAAMYPGVTDGTELVGILLRMEASLCKMIKAAVPGSTDGTQNLLQGIADDSEARQYQMKQRTAAP